MFSCRLKDPFTVFPLTPDHIIKFDSQFPFLEWVKHMPKQVANFPDPAGSRP